MRDQIGVRLSIISDTVSASYLDEYLGIKSDQAHVRGEMNSLGTKAYEHHAWFLKSRHEIQDDEDIKNCIATRLDGFLAKIHPLRDKIKALSNEHYVELSVYLSVQDIPPLGLSNSQIASIAALGIALDIDIVLYKPEK